MLKYYILSKECIYVFHTVLSIESDCFPEQHLPAGLIAEALCSL
jgi:hypothetical protein